MNKIDKALYKGIGIGMVIMTVGVVASDIINSMKRKKELKK